MSSFHPSFGRKETRTAQWTRNSVLLLNGSCRYKTWMEGTYDKPGMTKIHISSWYTEPNGMGFLPKCRQLVIVLIVLKHIQIDLQYWKLLMLKVRLYIFFFFLGGGGGGGVRHTFCVTQARTRVFPPMVLIHALFACTRILHSHKTGISSQCKSARVRQWFLEMYALSARGKWRQTSTAYYALL